MNFSNKRILITGGLGFIGSHICEKLYNSGVKELVIVDTGITGKKEFIKSFIGKDDVHIHKTDVRTNNMIKIMKDIDIVFHLAVRNVTFSIKNPLFDLQVNAGGTLNILEAAKKTGVEKFIYASSASVYGQPKKFPESEEDFVQPLSPYGISKLTGEKYTIFYHLQHGLNTTVLRYFNIYGPRQHFSFYGGAISRFIKNLILNKPPEIYGDGNQTRDFTFIDDCVRATLLAATESKSNGEIFNVATGKETSVNDLANLLIHISGKTIKPIHIEKREIIDNIIKRVGNTEKAKRLLSYEAEIPLETGLKKTYDWFLKSKIFLPSTTIFSP